MKIRIFKKAGQAASALFYTVILLVLTAVMLASYMLLSENEYITVGRSQVWNAAMVNAESGVEESLALINSDTTGWPSLASQNGWTTDPSYTNVYTWATLGSNTVYRIVRTNQASGNNISAGGYITYISYCPASTNGPEIYSVGTADWSGSTPEPNPARAIYVQTSGTQASGNTGLVAYQLTFNGNNVTIDSFDSSSPRHSIWHTNLWLRGANYGTWSNTLSYNSNSIPCRTANVHVAAETNYVDVGNANIYGYINTSPGGAYSVGKQGSVGDLNWVHNGNNGLQAGHFRDDMNQTFTSPDAPTLPATQSSWFPLVTGANGTTNIIRIGAVYSNGVMVGAGMLYTNKNNAGWVLPNGDGTTSTYDFVLTNGPQTSWTNNLGATHTNICYATGSLSDDIYVDCQYGILYLTNSSGNTISGQKITINTNADLIIYSLGNISIGTFVNSTACARALTISDVKNYPITVTASGNATMVARFLLPSSKFKFNGGGSDTLDLIGEIVGTAVTFDGHFNLHYDESLGTITPAKQTIATAWKEVGGKN